MQRVRTCFVSISQVIFGLFFMGCRPALPTDDEMIRHFLLHETAFDELRDLIAQRPCGIYYPPRHTDMSYGYDSLSVAGLSAEDRVLFDSLLKEIDCERVYYRNRSSGDGESGMSEYSLSIPYFEHRILTSGVYKEYLYRPEWNEELMPLSESSSELNDSFGWRDTVLYKSIKDGWYIRLVNSP